MNLYPDKLYEKISAYFIFYDEARLWRLVYYLDTQVRKIVGLDSPCPILRRSLNFTRRKGSIEVIGKLVGFDTDFHKSRLSLHDELNQSSHYINLFAIALVGYILFVANHLTNFEFSVLIASLIDTVNQELSIPHYSLAWWFISLPFFLVLISL